MLGVQVDNLHFFNVFFRSHCFIWFIFILSAFMLPYTIYSPRETSASADQLRKILTEKSSYSKINTK